MRTIGDFSRLNAERCPNKAAVLFEEEELSFSELDSLSNRVASALLARNVTAGDRVAVMAFNCPEFIILTQAVAKIGGILVPVNTRSATSEIAAVFTHCTPKLLFIEADFLATAQATFPNSGTLPIVTFRGSCGGLSFNDFIAGSSAKPLDHELSPDLPAAIMYTSGTSGTPKGVVISHDKYLRIFHAIAIEMGVRECDVFQLVMPMFHNGGFASVLNPALMIGATVSCGGGRFDPERTLRDIERHRVTVTHWVATMLDRILPLVEDGGYDLSSLRKITYGAMPMSEDILARAREVFDVTFFQGYGTTDAGLIACLTDEQHALRPRATGRPVFNTRCRVVGENGTPVAIGEIGEVVVDAQTSGMIGYWRDEQLTRQTIRNGWIHTGDMARRDADGFFTLVDRKNFMIISGGENIYPSEIEKVLVAHPDIRHVAVFGVPDPRFGEAVCAALVLSRPRALGIGDVQAFCDGRLARYKLPRHLLILDEMPFTATGKIAMAQLRETARQRGLTDAARSNGLNLIG